MVKNIQLVSILDPEFLMRAFEYEVPRFEQDT